MMFLTVEDMVATFGEEEMLQLAGTGPRDMRSLDRPKVEEAITHAVTMVQGYVRSRWPAVVPGGTPMLQGYAADIARWRLRGRGGQQTAMNETVQKRYDEAIRTLRDIAAGKLTLDLDPATAAVTGAADAANQLRVTGRMPDARTPGLLAGFRP
ncbi:DUF1320 domain-containing protein [Phreatobacter stygius]|uniref:DUF1320 domain-containing protein n=1 Tax=Phreatobacter stygius TaxID=1940610 RepID=A0A4D7B3L9_9HYPH|nr:DUF1320 domain-containing protein [Phreatobacter stygius]QCI65633.1 DUF1320 domain-containing protein [Phreatobacter stygius]